MNNSRIQAGGVYSKWRNESNFKTAKCRSQRSCISPQFRRRFGNIKLCVRSESVISFSFSTSTRNAIQLVTMLMSHQPLFSRSSKTAEIFTGISCFVALVMALLFLWSWSQWEVEQLRVNSSDIRNKFWCNVTVLVIVLSLSIPFKQCTLLIQHKQHKTNVSGFGLRTSFYLCCKRTHPLM